MTKLRTVAFMAAVQFVSYLNLTVNFRAIAHAQYAVAGLTAGLAAVLATTIVRRVAKDESNSPLVGMVVGGALADMAGIWLTRAW